MKRRAMTEAQAWAAWQRAQATEARAYRRWYRLADRTARQERRAMVTYYRRVPELERERFIRAMEATTRRIQDPAFKAALTADVAKFKQEVRR